MQQPISNDTITYNIVFFLLITHNIIFPIIYIF